MFAQGYEDYREYIARYDLEEAKEILAEYIKTIAPQLDRMDYDDRIWELRYIEGAKARLMSAGR